MLNPKHERFAKRIRELIEEGKTVASLERPSEVGPYIKEKIPLQSWLVKVKNIIFVIFGPSSVHQSELIALTKRYVEHSYQVNAIIGFLCGALNDLENGFLVDQEQLLASEILDSLVEKARQLVGTGFKDAAAVLLRVVLEDALKRLARAEGISDSLTPSQINDELKKAGIYAQPRWRQVQSWLDIGNAAAHGKFDEYSDADVTRIASDIEGFIASELA
ncbi:MAG TPA: DUF4145 domain-containing protein [archaeon]|nr:DUF4145 domain-containing protein [archaeon]